jgi:gas vesicle protein
MSSHTLVTAACSTESSIQPCTRKKNQLMSNDPEQIRREIDRTRTELSDNVNALGDKVNPGSIAKRQVGRVRGAATSVKDAVMGSAADTADRASTTAGGVVQTVSDAPNTVARKAQGSPIAAGLIAFGAGLLVSSLLPASRVEQRAAEKVKDTAQPLVDDLTDTAKEVAENLKEPAQHAVEEVKSTATDAAAAVKDQATTAAEEVKTQAQDSKNTVQHAAR